MTPYSVPTACKQPDEPASAANINPGLRLGTAVDHVDLIFTGSFVRIPGRQPRFLGVSSCPLTDGPPRRLTAEQLARLPALLQRSPEA